MIMHKELRVLIVDDSEDDTLLLVRRLRSEGYVPVFRRVDTPGDIRSALAEEPWDAVICDYVMPRCSAPEALKVLKESGPDIPFIVVSGVVGEETAVEMMKAGAHDYIRKEALARLAPAIEREIREAALRAERRRDEEFIRKSLREKEVLLREIHHRVKNNMQVISSMLGLQSRHIKDEEALRVFEDGRNRIRSMALIHEMLYRSEDFASIDFDAYIKTLASSLFGLYAVSPERVRLTIEVEEAGFGLDSAVPCGLIMNELLTNALKYAFPGERSGEVAVAIHYNGGRVEISVSDNGVGFPEGLDFRKTETLGLQLVVNLVKQLRGEIMLDRTGGTKFVITIKKEV